MEESRLVNGSSPGAVIREVDPTKVFSAKNGTVSCAGCEVRRAHTTLTGRVALTRAITMAEERIRQNRPDVRGRSSTPTTIGVLTYAKDAEELRNGFALKRFDITPTTSVYTVVKVLEDLGQARKTLAEMSIPR